MRTCLQALAAWLSLAALPCLAQPTDVERAAAGDAGLPAPPEVTAPAAPEADAAGPSEPPAHTLLSSEPRDVLREPEPVPPSPPLLGSEGYWQLGTGFNLGLIDLFVSRGAVWGEFSTVVGVPIATFADPAFAAVLAVGYGVPLGDNGAGVWYFDVFVEAVGARLNQSDSSGAVGGGGFGFGFRYLWPSGWTLGLRMPAFGLVVEDYNATHVFDAAKAEIDFYVANVFAWSFLTVGRRF